MEPTLLEYIKCEFYYWNPMLFTLATSCNVLFYPYVSLILSFIYKLFYSNCYVLPYVLIF